MSTQGWQPIETAPRDGSFFIAYSPGWRVGAYMCSWDKRHSVWIDHGDLDPVAEMFEPTHWQPLPPPPVEAEDKLERAAG